MRRPRRPFPGAIGVLRSSPSMILPQARRVVEAFSCLFDLEPVNEDGAERFVEALLGNAGLEEEQRFLAAFHLV